MNRSPRLDVDRLKASSILEYLEARTASTITRSATKIVSDYSFQFQRDSRRAISTWTRGTASDLLNRGDISKSKCVVSARIGTWFHLHVSYPWTYVRSIDRGCLMKSTVHVEREIKIFNVASLSLSNRYLFLIDKEGKRNPVTWSLFLLQRDPFSQHGICG